MAIQFSGERKHIPFVTNTVTKQIKTVTTGVTHLEQQIVALKARIAELESQLSTSSPKSAAERMREYRKRKKG